MKLHKDGTIEGTPSEIAEYNKLQEKKELFKVIVPIGLQERHEYYQPSAYVRGLMSMIGNRGDLH